MPSPLNTKLTENYFALLNAHLSQMPDVPREEHLRELHQHLDALIAARQEQGASEDAVSDALAQMGDPAQIGRKLWHEWKLTTQRQFWKTVIAIGVAQFIVVMGLNLLLLFARQHITPNLFYGLSTKGWIEISLNVHYLVPMIFGIVAGKQLPERAIFTALGIGLVCTLALLPVWAYIGISYHQWRLPESQVSAYEILGAYVVSSIKRKDWKVQVF